ncbi:MAG TPA: helix-turn-helix transcriptional regulator [Phototrophicaceae bacterium]|nr:helix-turn-helix transcriptional regulator [Phototrophicaceae bacterium]
MLSEPALPLTEATFLILLSLAPGPQHGYAIMKDVAALSEGRVVFSTGTLYGALKRLLEQGWIERVDSPEIESGRPRKDYQLTEAGRRLLSAEAARLETLAQAARLRLKPGAV